MAATYWVYFIAELISQIHPDLVMYEIAFIYTFYLYPNT